MKRFAKAVFLKASDQEKALLCRELAACLSGRITGSSDFHSAVTQSIEELRGRGHDLWSYDESDEFEVWGPNYEVETVPGLVITYMADGVVQVEWTHRE